jgi:PPOX class probable F420-dependent enzyme
MSSKQYPEWMGKMRGLNADEIKEFLAGPVVARLATIKPNGMPYITPVWQEWDGEALWFIPRERSAMVVHMKANPNVSLSCAMDGAPYTRLQIEGKADIVAGPEIMHGEWLEMARRMSTRYLGERGPEYLEPSVPRPRYWVKVVPDKLTSWEGVEWAVKYLE